jgi:hypothetical protein
MLLHDPYSTTGLVILIPLLVLNLVTGFRVLRIAKELDASGNRTTQTAGPGPSYIVYRPMSGLGSVCYGFFMVFLIWWINGFPLWDTNATFPANSNFLLFYLGYLAVVVALPLISLDVETGANYEITDTGITRHLAVRKTRTIRWVEVTDIKTYAGESGRGITIGDGRNRFSLNTSLRNMRRLYDDVLHRVPEVLGTGDAYRFIQNELDRNLKRKNGQRAQGKMSPMIWLGLFMWVISFVQLAVVTTYYQIQGLAAGLELIVFLLLFFGGFAVMLFGKRRSDRQDRLREYELTQNIVGSTGQPGGDYLQSNSTDVKWSGMEASGSHYFQGDERNRVFKAIMRWLDVEEAKIVEKREPHAIKAVHGHVLVLGVASRDAKKTLEFELKAVEGGVLVNLAMIPSAAYFDELGASGSAIVSNWGRLADEIWAFVEGRASTEEPAWRQKEAVEAFKRKTGRRVIIYSVSEVLLLVGAIILGPYVPGNVVRDAIGVVWFVMIMAFLVLIIPWLMNVVGYRSACRTLRRMKRKDELGQL